MEPPDIMSDIASFASDATFEELERLLADPSTSLSQSDKARHQVQLQTEESRRAAQSQADKARYQAQCQAEEDRRHAQSQSDKARYQAQCQAEESRRHAQSQSDKAKSQGHRGSTGSGRKGKS